MAPAPGAPSGFAFGHFLADHACGAVPGSVVVPGSILTMKENGAAGDRTPGLDSAIVALSQLSYCPAKTVTGDW